MMKKEKRAKKAASKPSRHDREQKFWRQEEPGTGTNQNRLPRREGYEK